MQVVRSEGKVWGAAIPGIVPDGLKGLIDLRTKNPAAFSKILKNILFKPFGVPNFVTHVSSEVIANHVCEGVDPLFCGIEQTNLYPPPLVGVSLEKVKDLNLGGGDTLEQKTLCAFLGVGSDTGPRPSLDASPSIARQDAGLADKRPASYDLSDSGHLKRAIDEQRIAFSGLGHTENLDDNLVRRPHSGWSKRCPKF